jgi:predicted ATP-dependent serine protease
VDEGAGFIAEISLSGELRPVYQIEKRVQEFRYSGFRRLFVSAGDLEKVKSLGFDGEIHGLSTLKDALDIIFE